MSSTSTPTTALPFLQASTVSTASLSLFASPIHHPATTLWSPPPTQHQPPIPHNPHSQPHRRHCRPTINPFPRSRTISVVDEHHHHIKTQSPKSKPSNPCHRRRRVPSSKISSYTPTLRSAEISSEAAMEEEEGSGGADRRIQIGEKKNEWEYKKKGKL
ncbi:hypothetical protein AKJ16_DCAP05780 [Drosera capensis]